MAKNRHSYRRAWSLANCTSGSG